MLIVDAQIHLWEKGTPSPPHRQEAYSAEEAVAAMDQGGVDRALIHPVLWDPDSNELAMQAVRQYPDRFRIMGWFYLDDPTSSPIGRSGRGWSGCASISTSGTSGSG
jgi:predicted TIM-barrel fold metal-dependent hydrolase